MTRASLLALAALCGAIIAIALAPRRYITLERLPDNLFEVQSLTMANDKAREIIRRQAEEIRLLKALAVLNGVVKG
jgi:hypothetical protein